MSGRAARIALALFQALWLNVIVPGHRRGMVALPGECATCQIVSRAPEICCKGTGSHQSHRKPTGGGDPAARCAICFFAARLTSPPAVTTAPLLLISAERLDLAAPEDFKGAA